jgi:hypothetical protein
MAATGWLDGAVRACMAPLVQADERLVALGWAAHVTVDVATARGRLSLGARGGVARAQRLLPL